MTRPANREMAQAEVASRADMPSQPTIELTLKRPLPPQFHQGSLIEVHPSTMADLRIPTANNRYVIMGISDDRKTVEVR